MVWPAVIAAGAAIGTAYMANRQKANSDADARRMLERAMAELDGIAPPGTEERKIILAQMKNVGELHPEMEAAVTVRDSEMNGVTTDPRFQQAQIDTLRKMGELSDGGLTDGDRARMEQITSQQAAENQGMQGAIGQNLRSRGLGSSGMEAAMRSQAVQSGADRARMQALGVNATASERALRALGERSSMATSMRDQEFGEKARVATSQDAVNRFREANLAGVNQRNVNSANEAARRNLENDQAIANSNTGISNYQIEHNTDAARQHYLDKLEKAKIKVGNTGTLSSDARQSAKDRAGMWGNIINGASTVGAAYMNKKDDE